MALSSGSASTTDMTRAEWDAEVKIRKRERDAKFDAQVKELTERLFGPLEAPKAKRWRSGILAKGSLRISGDFTKNEAE